MKYILTTKGITTPELKKEFDTYNKALSEYARTKHNWEKQIDEANGFIGSKELDLIELYWNLKIIKTQ